MKNIKLSYYWSIFAMGSGIGWLLGISVSPVISIVITSVTGSAAAIISALSGLESIWSNDRSESDRSQKKDTGLKINPIPLTVLIAGVVTGSILGILGRNNSILGSDISTEIVRWQKAGLIEAGITNQEAVLRLFNSQYPINPQLSSDPKQRSTLAGGTILFSISAEKCDLLSEHLFKNDSQSDTKLREELEQTDGLRELSQIVTDTVMLKRIVENVICS